MLKDAMLKDAKRKFERIEGRTRELAKNTKATAEFLAETVRAESRHFAHLAVNRLSMKLTGHPYKPQRDASLEPLDPVSRR